MTERFSLMKTSPYFTVCCEVGNCIVTRNNDCGYLCGYCAVPISFVDEVDTEKFAGTVPVHGGVTFQRRDDSGEYWIFGFDAAHRGDENVTALRDPAVLLGMAQEMEAWILQRLRED
ncbi:hypothetical protein FGU65_11085 [Methanoculleus sp. FWC-SCC1]|uniref:Uncharacterized protein n=1 Tax=Methanoculleus frigidifontis TaxID=2584085 RepID=A0ABT8MBY7_9EURY|nr:hypothetical protein [Methanoculleus sp. FWC-SCC1]MDN7025433.1 hypothetical protein [Methanoculleus sp. FWC-SCC1]